MPVVNPALEVGLFDVLMRYILPFILIVLSAPTDAFMPWFARGDQQNEEVYTSWTGKMKMLFTKTDKQEHSALTAMLFGVVALVGVVVVDVFLDLPRLIENYICLAIGIMAVILWMRYGKKTRNNDKKYK